jgi:hypothetical protein
MNTDIEILGNRIENLLVQCIEKYSRREIKKQYVNKLSIEIEVVNDCNFKIIDKNINSNRMINKLIEDRMDVVINDIKKEVVIDILH